MKTKVMKEWFISMENLFESEAKISIYDSSLMLVTWF